MIKKFNCKIIMLYFIGTISIYSQIIDLSNIDIEQIKNRNRSFDTTIDISTDKIEYLFQEKIWVTIKVHHRNGEGPYKGIVGTLIEKFIVTDQQGHIYSPHVSFSVGMDQRMEIGEVIEWSEEISSVYSEHGMENSGLFPAGELKVYCEFFNGTKYIKSNELVLIISSPFDREFEVYKIYKSALRTAINKHQTNEAVLLFDSIVGYYPHSVYAPAALKKSIFYSDISNEADDLVVNKAKRMIEYYPRNHYIKSIIRLLKYRDIYTNKNELKHYLNAIADTTSIEELKIEINKELKTIR